MIIKSSIIRPLLILHFVILICSTSSAMEPPPQRTKLSSDFILAFINNPADILYYPVKDEILLTNLLTLLENKKRTSLIESLIKEAQENDELMVVQELIEFNKIDPKYLVQKALAQYADPELGFPQGLPRGNSLRLLMKLAEKFTMSEKISKAIWNAISKNPVVDIMKFSEEDLAHTFTMTLAELRQQVKHSDIFLEMENSSILKLDFKKLNELTEISANIGSSLQLNLLLANKRQRKGYYMKLMRLLNNLHELRNIWGAVIVSTALNAVPISRLCMYENSAQFENLAYYNNYNPKRSNELRAQVGSCPTYLFSPMDYQLQFDNALEAGIFPTMVSRNCQKDRARCMGYKLNCDAYLNQLFSNATLVPEELLWFLSESKKPRNKEEEKRKLPKSSKDWNSEETAMFFFSHNEYPTWLRLIKGGFYNAAALLDLIKEDNESAHALAFMLNVGHPLASDLIKGKFGNHDIESVRKTNLFEDNTKSTRRNSSTLARRLSSGKVASGRKITPNDSPTKQTPPSATTSSSSESSQPPSKKRPSESTGSSDKEIHKKSLSRFPESFNSEPQKIHRFSDLSPDGLETAFKIVVRGIGVEEVSFEKQDADGVAAYIGKIKGMKKEMRTKAIEMLKNKSGLDIKEESFNLAVDTIIKIIKEFSLGPSEDRKKELYAALNIIWKKPAGLRTSAVLKMYFESIGIDTEISEALANNLAFDIFYKPVPLKST